MNGKLILDIFFLSRFGVGENSLLKYSTHQSNESKCGCLRFSSLKNIYIEIFVYIYVFVIVGIQIKVCVCAHVCFLPY